MCFFDSNNQKLNTQIIDSLNAVVAGGSLNAVNVLDECEAVVLLSVVDSWFEAVLVGKFVTCADHNQAVRLAWFHNWDYSSLHAVNCMYCNCAMMINDFWSSVSHVCSDCQVLNDDLIEAGAVTVETLGDMVEVEAANDVVSVSGESEAAKCETTGSLFEAASEVGVKSDIVLGDLVFRQDTDLMYYVKFRDIHLGLVFLHPKYNDWNFQLFSLDYKVSSRLNDNVVIRGNLSQNWSQIVETFVNDNLEVLQKFRNRQSLKVVTCGCGRVGLVSSNKRKSFVCQTCKEAA